AITPSTQRVIYVSTNLGATWTTTDSPATYWRAAVTCAADGNRFMALGEAFLATLQRQPQPALTMGRLGADLKVSWLVPSAPFVLQQSSGLSATDWQDVSNPAKFNATNLNREVTVSLRPGNTFY